MGKKQDWFYIRARSRLESFEREMKDEFLRREWQFVPIVLRGKYIMFRIERMRKKIVPADVLSTDPIEDFVVWSSMQIVGIVDFDIELERMLEFIRDPKPLKGGQDAAEALPLPATNPLLTTAKATGEQRGHPSM